jgi:hypothetical protein
MGLRSLEYYAYRPWRERAVRKRRAMTGTERCSICRVRLLISLRYKPSCTASAAFYPTLVGSMEPTSTS